jgi:Bacterial pre-peptidase C-terminal domain
MFKRNQLRQAVAAALLAASSLGNLALADTEVEPENTMGVNDPMFDAQGNLKAQRLTFTGGRTEVEGIIGTTKLAVNGGQAIPDVDFYAFEAYKGNVLNIDIDNGMKVGQDPDPAKQVRSVDTILAIFGPLPSVTKADEGLNMPTSSDPDGSDGSKDFRDAFIDNFVVPADGIYVVGVSSQPRFFKNEGGGTTSTSVTGTHANGKYTLIITGVIPPVVQVKIDVKPGSRGDSPVNPKAKGVIPVAILSQEAIGSSQKFDALTLKPYSLTFGKTGNEKSYLGCHKHGMDVNADGLLDLVCTFDNQAANWDVDDVRGVLKGVTEDGTKFEGRGPLKVVPKVRD